MKVLITGGSGLVGSHVAEELLAQGDEVLVIDNYATGRRDNLKPHPNLTIAEGSIAETEFVQQTFAEFGPQKVVHAAAAYKNPDDWTEDIDTNVRGTANVVQASKSARVDRIVYFQTALCYGMQPLEQPITINHPIRPEGSSYALSKTGGEQYIALSGIDYVTFRLANVYGPRSVSGPLCIFFQRLTAGKPCFVTDTRRDFVFVNDLVAIVLRALSGEGRPGTYHVSSGGDVAIREMYDAAVESLGIQPVHEVEVRPRAEDDVYSILLDPSKTTEEFDWSVTVDLKTGVQRTIDYYREFGVAETYTHLRRDAA